MNQISGIGDGGNANTPDDNNEPEWQTGLGAEESVIPADGTIYIILMADPVLSVYNQVWVKNISINYQAQGLYNISLKAKSDYWITSANKNIKDTIEDTVRISDCAAPSVKGTLYTNDDELTATQWYRQGIENKLYHYKELQNLSKWQQSYKRPEKVSGEFKGFNYAPGNNPNAIVPASFHHRFTFVDFNPDKTFVLVPPLSFNLNTGIMEANFIEINMDEDNYGDEHKIKFNF